MNTSKDEITTKNKRKKDEERIYIYTLQTTIIYGKIR